MDSATPLDGYFYQLDVSVWAALDLLLAKRRAQEVVLEPASKEDLETDIAGEPGALAESVDIDSYRLVIQCKLRTTGPWKIASLNTVLAHGTRRKSARVRLADSNIRYLLVTNADVENTARKLAVKDLDFWPSSLPATVANKLPAGASGRVAVLATMDPERLRFRTETMLKERFRVPAPRVAECREKLRADALARMSGVGQGRWRRDELERILVAHGGYVGDSDALEGFVRPTNWDEMTETLDTQHAIIISGPSGTGKTRSAKALIARLHDQLPGLTVVDIAGGPEKILAVRHPVPVVFEIEDPWGRFRLEPTSVPWNDGITGVLATAGPDRIFVITSRSDVLGESGPRRLAKKWLVSLEEENYGTRERTSLFEQRLPSLPTAQQAIVVQYRKEAVDRLPTPLEMQRYFDVLMDGPLADENDRQYVERCLAEAHQGSIEAAILNNVRKREDWPLAAVVWGLFKSRAKQSFATIPAIQAGLTARDAKLEDRLEPYLNFLIAGRNLRQHGPSLTYHHPRVELGLEQALLEKPEQSSRMLRYLIETLFSLDAQHDTDWGREGAAHIVAAAAEFDQIKINLDSSTQLGLDAWLQDRLLSGSSDFEDDLRLVAVAASPASNAGELARWLTNRPRSAKHSWFLDSWSAEQKPETWYARLRNDPAIKPICERFIREHLTRTRHFYGANFASKIAKFADGLTSSFLAAALKIVEDGVNSNDDAIAAGALADLDGFEKVVSAALDYQAKLRAQPDDGLWLSLANEEYSEDAAEHYADNDEGYTADVLLKAFVRALRQQRGWQAVRDHSRAAELIYEWIHTIVETRDAPDEEWEALAKAALASRYESRFWDAVGDQTFASLTDFLVLRLTKGSEDLEARLAATKLAAVRLPAIFGTVAASLLQDGNMRRIFQIAADLEFIGKKEKQPPTAALAALVAGLPSDPARTARALFDPTEPLDKEALSYVASLDANSDPLLTLSVARVLQLNGRSVSALLAARLAADNGNNDLELRFATQTVSLAIDAEAWPAVELALQHRFADVRQRALVALAGRSQGVLPGNLLALAADKGSGVRKALLALLQQRRHPEHRQAILLLAEDNWSPHSNYYGQDPDHPIAVGAAELLAEAPPLDRDQVDAIGKIVLANGDSNGVRRLFLALVKNGDIESKRRVLRFAMRTGRLPLHALAAEALLGDVEHLEADIADAIPVEQLAGRVAAVACPLALIVGAAASPQHLLVVAREIAAKPARHALVALIWLTASERGIAVADDVIKLLPGAFAKELRRAAAGKRKLARDSIDNLADIRIAEGIRSRLSFLFRPKPKANAKAMPSSGFTRREPD